MYWLYSMASTPFYLRHFRNKVFKCKSKPVTERFIRDSCKFKHSFQDCQSFIISNFKTTLFFSNEDITRYIESNDSKYSPKEKTIFFCHVITNLNMLEQQQKFVVLFKTIENDISNNKSLLLSNIFYSIFVSFWYP